MRAPNNFARALVEAFSNLSFDGCRSPNERAERWSTRQIINHFMAAGRNPGSKTELLLRIEDRHGANFARRRNIELPTGQPLPQKPKATGVRARRFRTHESAEFVIGNDFKKRGEHSQVQRFPFQRELEVSGQSILWRVPGCQ